MNTTTLEKGALFYCNVRIVSNIVLAVSLAVISLWMSYKFKSILSNDFLEAKAQIISINLNKEQGIYYPIYKISFKNSKNNQVVTELRDITKFFPDQTSGENFIAQQKNKATLNVFYSEKDPLNDIVIKGQEKFISSTFLLVSLSLVVFAILSYILLGNPIYCGFVIFRDIFTLFSF
jgi:hypothetical protein